MYGETVRLVTDLLPSVAGGRLLEIDPLIVGGMAERFVTRPWGGYSVLLIWAAAASLMGLWRTVRGDVSAAASR